jgi:amidase/aspartyl-tRNA(Asn)/glutamyl-tRNA(Gln) amidotransferase subunit A
VQALRELRRGWQQRVGRSIAGFDAVIAPTVPIVAPLLQPLVDSDELYTATNLLLLRNPSIVNQLDGCAISLPCHEPGELPVGLMLFSNGHRDDALLDAALQVESALGHGDR